MSGGKTTRRERWVMAAAIAASLSLSFPFAAEAMHIMEGYLPPASCIAWGAASLPFFAWGLCSVKRLLGQDGRNLVLLAMSGAFIFMVSSLKIPSVTGSCSHMTGTGLGALLFGPAPMAVMGLVALAFQALLLAHGGLTTLGANLFSMAVAGPIMAYAAFRILRRCRMGTMACVFWAAFLGDLSTYCVTALQLAAAYPSADGGMPISAVKFLGVFAPTQLPLAVVEGILTVVSMMALESYAGAELRLTWFGKGDLHG